MKKSIFLIAAFVAVFSVPFVSCSGTNDKDDKNKTKEIPKELQELVTEMNKHCPISAGSIGDMVSAEIKGDNVVFTLDVYEDLIDLEYLQS